MDIDKIFGEAPKEELIVSEEEQVETPAEPQAEKESEGEAPLEEGAKKAEEPKEEPKPEENTPKEEEAPAPKESYRWAEMRRQAKADREAREATERRLAELENQLKSKSQDTEEIPKEFVDLFGENKEAWSAFNKLTEAQAQKIVESRFAEVEKKKQEESTAEARYQEAIQEEFELLGDKLGKDFSEPSNSERNAILQVALKYTPTNAQGNIDLEKSYEIYKMLNPEKPVNDERKKIAALATGNAPKVEDTATVKFGQARKMSIDQFLE